MCCDNVFTSLDAVLAEVYSSKLRCVATADWLTRAFVAAARGMGADEKRGGSWGGVKGGDVRFVCLNRLHD